MNPSLSKNDITKLESYWLTYRDLIGSLENISTTPEEAFKQSQIANITSAIETIYNESRDTVRNIIEEAYFHSNISVIDSSRIAKEVGCTNRRVNLIRESLMIETAAIIGWV